MNKIQYNMCEYILMFLILFFSAILIAILLYI